jgi:predicted alpha/beta-hydrolase family hydrolase
MAELEVRMDVDGRPSSGLWSESERPAAVAVIAHGAGNTMRHPYFDGIAAGLLAEHVTAFRFNFPYAEAGRGYPDRAPILMEAWRVALRTAGDRSAGVPLAATGKSLGGRIASMVAAEDGEAFAARALVFFGYPLHAPGKADQPRDAHLRSIRIPMLFIEGTKDPFARFDLIEASVAGLGSAARIHLIEGGDHSHRVRGFKRSDRAIGEELGRVAGAFIREVTG